MVRSPWPAPPFQARMVQSGLDTVGHDYARFLSTQHTHFVKHLADGTDGIFFHGEYRC